MSDSTQPIEELGFEEAMHALDSLVASLESGQMPLEDMVSAYERGMNLLRVCRSRIDTARRRVEAINLNLEGKPQATLTEFAPLDSLVATAGQTSASTGNASKRNSASSTGQTTARSREKEKEKDAGSDTGEIRLI